MTRFLLAAALAAGGTLALSEPAQAQYVYRYQTVNPWTGAQAQRYSYQNAWGTNVYRNSGFNPYYGGFNRGYAYPGFGASPLAGSWYNYRW